MIRISKCHNAVLRRIMGPPKAEAAVEYMKNAMATVADIRILYNIERWPLTCRRLSQSWAGHLQSPASASSDRVAH
eukprot:9112082-Pyramimonas_sp.AAC.1